MGKYFIKYFKSKYLSTRKITSNSKKTFNTDFLFFQLMPTNVFANMKSTPNSK